MTSIERHQPRPDTGAVRAWIGVFPDAAELAKAIAATGFVPKTLRNNPAEITAAILYGDEVGLGPMQSLAKIALIDGRPALAAEAQRALIYAAGHEMWTVEATVTSVTVAGRRAGSDNVVAVTWTMDDARRANLAGKTNWRGYPRQMLHARASAELARSLFPDAIGGLAAVEELMDTDPMSADPVPTVAERSTKRARKGRTPLVVAATPAEHPSIDGPPLPDEEPAPMSDAQRRKVMALFRERGLGGTDKAAQTRRHDYAEVVIGRPVESSGTLTVDEASQIIDVLEAELSASSAQTVGPDPEPETAPLPAVGVGDIPLPMEDGAA